MASIAQKRRASKPQLLGDKAFELMRRDIIQCTLAPGIEVTEIELAERYKLGRAPVRSALVRLCQDGLLDSVPRRGYVVRPITIEDVHDMFEMRMIIEPATTRLAVGRVDAAELREICRGPSLDVPEQSEIFFIRSNYNLHVAIARATGNRRLVHANATLLDEMARLIHLGLFTQARAREAAEQVHFAARQEHDLLIEAIEAADPDAAEKASRDHVEKTRDLVIQAMIQNRMLIRV